MDTESLKAWLDAEISARLTAMDSKLDRILAGHVRGSPSKQLESVLEGNGDRILAGHVRCRPKFLDPVPEGDDYMRMILSDKSVPRSPSSPSASSSYPETTPDTPCSALQSSISCRPVVENLPTWLRTRNDQPIKEEQCTEMLQEKTFDENLSKVSEIWNPDGDGKKKVHRLRRGHTFVHALARERLYRDLIFSFLDDPESGRLATLYAEGISTFTVFTVFITTIQTVDPPVLNGVVAAIFETFFDAVFILDVGLRFICCPNPKIFFNCLFNVLDVVNVGMFVIRAYAGFNLIGAPDLFRVILLCLAPTLRFMKTLRRFEKLALIYHAFKSAFEALPMLIWFLLATVLVSSTAIYLAERPANIDSIPTSMWFVIVTLSTVGYGDISPTTTGGHFLTALLIIFSALYMAMPLGIMGNAFTEVWDDRDRILLIQQARKRLRLWGYAAEDIPIIFDTFDEDRNGTIELSEFLAMMHEMRIGLSAERIIALFACIDKDGSGTIDDREFVRQVFPERFLKIYEMQMETVSLCSMDSSANVGDLRRRFTVAEHRIGSLLYKRRSTVHGTASNLTPSAEEFIARMKSAKSMASKGSERKPLVISQSTVRFELNGMGPQPEKATGAAIVSDKE